MTYRIKMSDGTEFGPAGLEEIVQWAREGRIPRDALLYPTDGGEPRSVFAEPRIAAILIAPPTTPTQPVDAPSSKPPSRLIPTGNLPALWGYYVGVFSFLMPIACPISFVLGAVGVVRAITKPEAKGLLHAIAAIVLSVGSPLFWYFVWHWAESM